MRNKINTDLWLSRIGLGLILCYCLAASIFYSYFAQIHLTLSFLPFPIFIGEILLFICLVLFLIVPKDAQLFNRRSIIVLSLYFAWVLFKALINYCYDGPLTLRNAALFYYPVFAVFSYCFYQKAKIPRPVLMWLAVLAAGIILFKGMVVWCWWTYITLFIIAVWNTKPVKLRWIGWIFVVLIFLLGKDYLYKGPRAHFVSVICAIGFLVSYFGTLLAKRRDYLRLSILLIGLLFFIIGFIILADRNDFHSVTSFRDMIKTYHDFDAQYQAKQAGYVSEKLSVHLYNPKKFKTLLSSSTSSGPEPVKPQAPEIPAIGPQATGSQTTTASSGAPPSSIGSLTSSNSDYFKNIPLPDWLKDFIGNFFNNIQRSQIQERRSLDVDENNIIFRLFVWRDMAHELIEKRAWGGFSFGHPQRSKSLEVLGWAESEWGRDGWIAPHNSFFHIIYRAGILGVVLIIILFLMIARLVKDFIRRDSIEGGFLVGGLVYWLVLSNFFVILEFPYNAIIFWTLFGITWSYRKSLQTKIQEKRMG